MKRKSITKKKRTFVALNLHQREKGHKEKEEPYLISTSIREALLRKKKWTNKEEGSEKKKRSKKEGSFMRLVEYQSCLEGIGKSKENWK